MASSRIGLGTWKANDPNIVEAAILHAIDAGYRHIDTAQFYGNEEVLGNALKKAFALGKIARTDLWVTTKLPNFHHRPSLVERSLLLSLQRLQLSYVDLYLVHWPDAEVPDEGDWTKGKLDEKGVEVVEKVDILDLWEKMEEMKSKGLAKEIGVSNFSIEMLERMEFSDRVHVQPYTNQVELNLYCQQRAMIHYLERRGMPLWGFSPFGNGGRVGPFGTTVLEDPVLADVAKSVGKSPGQVLLKFLLTLSPIVHVLPKSTTPARISANIDLAFGITAAQAEALAKRNTMHRFFDPVNWGLYDVLGIGR